MKKKNLAFTLAEVLIVIGIIGVVAALTLPNLNHATGDKEKVTKVKKIYSNLTEAVDRAQAIYGDFNTWFNDLSTQAEKNERFAKRVTEFLKVSKDCGLSSGCFTDAPLKYFADDDGEGTIHFDNYLETLQAANAYMVTLSDGTSLAFDCSALSDDGCNEYKIRVDIDGSNKGSNKTGVDNFDFAIVAHNWENDMVMPENQLCPSVCYELSDELGSVYNASNYSTAWAIENGNLDYLKCYDELNWETKTSCE